MTTPRLPAHVKCEIRARLKKGERQIDIAKALGLHRDTVGRVKRNVFRAVRRENVEFVPAWLEPKYLREGWTTVPDQKADWAVLMVRPANVAPIIIGT